MLILELRLWVLNESFRQCNIRTHQVCPLLEQISDVVLWSSCMCKYKYIHDRIVLVLVTFYQLNFGVTLYIFYKWLFMSPCVFALYSTSYDGCHLVYCYNVCHLVGPVPAVSAPRGLAPVAAGLVSRVLVLPHAQPAGGLTRGPRQVIFIYS